MKSQQTLRRISSLGGILLNAALNYFQWTSENWQGTFSPSKTPSGAYEHLLHYTVFHLIYLLLNIGIISLWFYSTKKIKSVVHIHLVVLAFAGIAAVCFKNEIALPSSGILAKTLINDLLQKPVYPLLLLLFFIVEERQGKQKNTYQK